MRPVTSSHFDFSLHQKSRNQLERYLADIKRDPSMMGARLAYILQNSVISELNWYDLCDALVRTWSATVFAEKNDSQPHGIHGLGADWTQREIELCGRLGYMMPDLMVSARRTGMSCLFDPEQDILKPGERADHRVSFLVSNGPLVAGVKGGCDGSVLESGHISYTLLRNYYCDRLRPLFLAAQQKAAAQGVNAVISLPILGAGEFSGGRRQVQKADGSMIPIAEAFEQIVVELAQMDAARLPNIRALVVDHWKSTITPSDERIADTGIRLIRNSSCSAGENEGKLPVGPGALAEAARYGGDLTADDLKFVVLAGDHVSMACNDWAAGSAMTNEGGTAALTSAAGKVYATDGRFDPDAHTYVTGTGQTWREIGDEKRIQTAVGNIFELDEDGNYQHVVISHSSGYRPGELFLSHQARTFELLDFVRPVISMAASAASLMPSPGGAPEIKEGNCNLCAVM